MAGYVHEVSLCDDWRNVSRVACSKSQRRYLANASKHFMYVYGNIAHNCIIMPVLSAEIKIERADRRLVVFILFSKF